MNDALRDALSKAGLATKEKARKASQKARHKRNTVQHKGKTYSKRVFDRVARYPKNRLGEPYHYAWWYCSKQIPKDAHCQCALCGAKGLDPIDAFEKVVMQGEDLQRTAEDTLLPFNLELFTMGRTHGFFQNKDASICKSCARNMLPMLGD
jgi:hypothetical protein